LSCGFGLGNIVPRSCAIWAGITDGIAENALQESVKNIDWAKMFLVSNGLRLGDHGLGARFVRRVGAALSGSSGQGCFG